VKKQCILTVFVLISGIAFGQIQDADTIAGRRLEEVVITGQYEPQSLKKSVYQVRTIDREIIQMRNPVNLQGILNTEVGIRFSQDPALGTADITLMGMSGQNVKILMDGVPMLDRGATRESLNQIDINTIERIEIVEGPMSVVYGTDALAGVINIITKKGTNDKAKLSLNARVMEETAGDEYSFIRDGGVHNESVNATGNFGKWHAGAGATRNIFGGWNVDDMAQRWLPKDQYLGNASFGYNNAAGFNAWYRLNYVFENIKTPGTVDAQNKRIDKEYISNRFTHQAQAEWKASDKLSFTGILSHQDYSRRTRTTEYNVATGQKFLVDPDQNEGAQDLATFSSDVIRITSVYKISPKTTLQYGTDININNGEGDRIDGNRTINDYALFVTTELEPTSWLSVRPGVRFLYNTQYDAPPAVPSLNTKIKLSERVDFRLSYARGFRAPSLRELYFSFFDASHSIKGNPNLKAEFSHSFTGSLAWQAIVRPATRLTSTLGMFHNTFDNMITFATDPSDPTGVLTTYLNVYKNRTDGFTLANTFFHGPWQVNLGGSYIGVYNDFSEDDSSLPLTLWSPEINTTLVYRFEKIGASASIFYKWSGPRTWYQNYFDQADGQEKARMVKLDPYQWSDITLTKQLGKYVNVSAGVKNIFDVVRVGSSAAGSAHTTGGSQPTGYGRSYFLGLNFQLDKHAE
jgi:outer membrane receptor for ferrienterochelin and colicins